MQRELSVSKKNLINFVVLALYAVLLFMIMGRHEPFRDEAQQWLLARDLSVPELLRQMSYEGHPCLWYLILMPFAKGGMPFGFATYISIALFLVAAAMILWKGPMGFGWKIIALLTSGFLYFGPIMGRSYSMIPLLLMLNACLYPNRHAKALRYGLTIALLIQTHVVMMGFAAAICFVWLAEAFINYKKDRNVRALMHQACGLMLPLISVLFFLYQMMNVTNASAMNPTLALNMKMLIRMVRRFANFYTANNEPMSGIFALAGTGCMIAATWLTYRKKQFEVFKPLLIFWASLIISWAISVIIYYLTEHSRMVICYLAVWFLWVAAPQVREKCVKIAVYGFYAAICVAWMLGNLNSTARDWNGVYSDMENCAAFISENLEADDVIISSNSCLGAGVAVYLDEHTIYSRRTGEKMTFCDYRKHDVVLSSYEALTEWLKDVNPDAETVYFLSDLDEKIEDNPKFVPYADNIECVYSTDNNAISDRYVIYSMDLV